MQREKKKSCFPKISLSFFRTVAEYPTELDGFDSIVDSPLLIQRRHHSRNTITLLLSPASSLTGCSENSLCYPSISG